MVVAVGTGLGPAVDAAEAQVPELDRQRSDQEVAVPVRAAPASACNKDIMHSSVTCNSRCPGCLLALALRILLLKDAAVWCARLYVISKCKRLKVLDFRRVTEKVGSSAFIPPYTNLCRALRSGSRVGLCPRIWCLQILHSTSLCGI